jgi:dCMP deaminase
MIKRPSKIEYYLGLALTIAERSPCSRRRFGAIIVKDDAIVSTGYNGPARGSTNCEIGCIKELLNLPHGSRYEFCPAIHAEENAIINAARNGVSVIGGTLYISGFDAKTLEKVEASPCQRCKRVLINAGIKRAVIGLSCGFYRQIDVEEWVREDKKNYEDVLREHSKDLYLL